MDGTGVGSCLMASLMLAVLNIRSLLPESWLVG